MAPHGDERMDYTPAYFYGSLLIELSFAREGDIFDKLAQPPLPSPSNVWLLNRPSSSVEPALDVPIQNSLAESLAALANDDTPNCDESLLSILGNDHGMADLFGASSDLRAWPATSERTTAAVPQLPITSSLDIFSGTQGDIGQYELDVDWPWLSQSGDGYGHVHPTTDSTNQGARL